ncbi:hypothetical protein FOXG_21643 [Fusarium oxysporum f. sp. lycopersici 4287]|uniref:Uncharacterized protein n=1 Tax=Fusarium oxysporum f. sp. lycopersici (strain 4287 / CBS 123668 / FGSC 9935 / NRRL 34936) TaxID=426428 RepID=A0A0J9VZI9_FUSO4|nr:hypothetical protein FOXG_21643 [Fusarium oxysporum f. sp. lycopersici 4287]KAJ9414896.1 hypothetical protein QL093DRAFT_2105437 [Fusarium oxysporum]KNB16364.1 hypothetical protein FOXG_21643 [Fusarium oxysporum f. sp. lycopersici 4287]
MTKLRLPWGDESPYDLLTNSRMSWKIIYPRNTIPFDAFNFEGFIRSSNKIMITENVSLLCYAAFQRQYDALQSLIQVSDMGDWRFRKELDKSLFFALCAGDRRMAHILLHCGADPGRKHSSCGLHGAARRGFHDEIKLYIQDHDACPNTKDEMSATPITYAMMLEAPRDWETIYYLFELGADPNIVIDGWTYAQWARKMGKDYLALRLDEAARRDELFQVGS